MVFGVVVVVLVVHRVLFVWVVEVKSPSTWKVSMQSDSNVFNSPHLPNTEPEDKIRLSNGSCIISLISAVALLISSSVFACTP